jgi:CheY-like chemotaxis protein
LIKQSGSRNDAPPASLRQKGPVSVRVLLIEDEKSPAETLAAGLRADGFTVDAAGLDWAQTTTYDAIVLDIMLPGMSGHEVVRRLRGGRRVDAGADAHCQRR